MGKHAADVLQWVEEVAAEDVDFVLEDSQDLADGRDVKESVNRREEDSLESGLENVGSKVSLISLFAETSELGKDHSDQREERCFAHVGLVGISLVLGVDDGVLSIHALDVVVPEFLELSVACEQDDRNGTSEKCPELCVGI